MSPIFTNFLEVAVKMGPKEKVGSGSSTPGLRGPSGCLD